MKLYNTIVPSEMSIHELQAIKHGLHLASQNNQKNLMVKLKNGNSYNVPVENLKDYQQFPSIHTGQTQIV